MYTVVSKFESAVFVGIKSTVVSGLADTLQVGSELWGYLMSRDYSPHVVPLKNISDSLQVSMGMTLFYIRELVRMWYY